MAKKSNRKITIANPESIERMKAIEMRQKGATFKEIGQAFGIHESTASEWCKMYEQGGAEALKAPRKPRPKYDLDVQEIETLLQGALSEKDKTKLAGILMLAKTKKLNETAAALGITPQGLMKWRRQYENGELPKTIML